MALKLIANYSKRLGLPGYSSHQFSVSVETEISNINEVAAESNRLYLTLQKSVDEEIQSTGFVPEHGYGTNGTPTPQQNGTSGTNRTNGHHANGNGNGNGVWKCSDKQRDLIKKLMVDNNLARSDVQNLAQEMFGTSEVSSLNKLQASGLIERLIGDGTEKPPRRVTRPRSYQGRGG